MFKVIFSFLLLILCCNGLDTNLERLNCTVPNDFVNNKSNCEKLGCIYSPSPSKDAPTCYFDTQKIGYKVVHQNQSDNGASYQLKLKNPNTTQFAQFDLLTFDVEFLTENILRFKIIPQHQKRYEVPIQKDFPLLNKKINQEDKKQTNYNIQVNQNNQSFDFSITRKDNNLTIWNTSIGGLIYSDQLIQIASYLPSKNIYGIGENIHESFKHDLNYKTWPVFAAGPPVEYDGKNEYGSHPFYICVENDGKSNGVFFLNSNAMEFALLPAPGISFKTIGGIIDVFVFVGQNPNHVVQLYTSLIGNPLLPSYWALGFQITRYGYKNTSHVNKVIQRNHKANIPMDVHYLDIDYMSTFQDFTYDRQNFENITDLMARTRKEQKLKWILILDPAINANDTHYEAFSDGLKNDVFIKWPKNIPEKERNNPKNVDTTHDIMYGRVWPYGPAAFPDFFKNSTKTWWKKSVKHLHDQLEFDGLWIDMNEPYNFDTNDFCPGVSCYNMKCPTNNYDDLSFSFKPVWSQGIKRLCTQTICMIATQGENNEFKHYDVHSLYGFTESIPTVEAVHEITNKRGFVLSRSTYVSSGKYVAHWLGDNTSKWSHLRHSIIGIMEFSLFGISFTGADICGFMNDTTPELCKRWLQAGAFYTFSRSHNEISVQVEQDPGVWAENGHPEVTDAARNALNVRYKLLPYLYTLFYRSHVFGDMVTRSLAFEYPTDKIALDVHEQFMWGSSMIISPFLYPNQTKVKAYLPKDTWYFTDWKNFYFTAFESKGEYVEVFDSIESPPIHLKGGKIFPLGESKLNTEEQRKEGLSLLVLPKDKKAHGELFWDDGESIDTIKNGKYNHFTFDLNNCSLIIEKHKSGFNGTLSIKNIVVSQVKGNEEVSVDVDGSSLKVSPKNGQLLFLVNIDLQTHNKTNWNVSWKTKSNQCNL